MPSKASSASQALDDYINDFETTHSDISDYYSLPISKPKPGNVKERPTSLSHDDLFGFKDNEARKCKDALDAEYRALLKERQKTTRRKPQQLVNKTEKSPSKSFYDHYLECIEELGIDARLEREWSSSRKPLRDGEKHVDGKQRGVFRRRLPSWVGDITTENHNASTSYQSRRAPSWLDLVSTVDDQSATSGRHRHASTSGHGHAPSWVELVAEGRGWRDQQGSLMKSKSLNSIVGLPEEQIQPKEQMPYRQMMALLFQQQDLRMQRMRLAKKRAQSLKQPPTIAAKDTPVAKPHKTTKHTRKSPDSVATDVLLGASAYGRVLGADENGLRMVGKKGLAGLWARSTPRTPQSDDAVILSHVTEQGDDQNECEALESELAGDRSWERPASKPLPLVDDVMAKRSVETLKNLLFNAQANLTSIEKDVKPQQQQQLSPAKISPSKSSIVRFNDSVVPPQHSSTPRKLFPTPKSAQITTSHTLSDKPTSVLRTSVFQKGFKSHQNTQNSLKHNPNSQEFLHHAPSTALHPQTTPCLSRDSFLGNLITSSQNVHPSLTRLLGSAGIEGESEMELGDPEMSYPVTEDADNGDHLKGGTGNGDIGYDDPKTTTTVRIKLGKQNGESDWKCHDRKSNQKEINDRKHKIAPVQSSTKMTSGEKSKTRDQNSGPDSSVRKMAVGGIHKNEENEQINQIKNQNKNKMAATDAEISPHLDAVRESAKTLESAFEHFDHLQSLFKQISFKIRTKTSATDLSDEESTIV